MHPVDKAIRTKFRVKRKDNLPYTGWLKSYRNDIYGLLNELGLNRGVEVGSWVGTNAKQMFKIIEGLHLTIVDPWTPFSTHDDESMERVFERCQRRLRHWNPEYIRKPSVEAAKDIEDGSLDFCYIDGMHDFDNVMLDIINWVPKVKKGGIVSGHDYFFGYRMGIMDAVHAYVKAHNITEWYVTGGARQRKAVHEIPSFFWVNK